MPSLYDRTTKLEETLAQFMQVSMSNQESMESAIKNLEVQVGQLAKQLAERPSSSFTANREKNPKEECKAVMTRSRMAIQAKEGRTDQKVEGFKQQLADQPTLEPIDDLVELEEIVEEAEEKDEKCNNKKNRLLRLRGRGARVRSTQKRRQRLLLLNARRYLIHWYPPKKIKSVIWPDFLISLRNSKLVCLLEKHFNKCPSMPNSWRIC